MKVFALFLLLLVAAVVFGGIAYFSYTMFVAPAKEAKAERVAAAVASATPEPTPEPGLDAFESAIAMVSDRERIFDAIAALQQFVTTYPNASVIGEAKSALGELNAAVVYTTIDSPEKLAYTVVSGDSLARIASRTNSSAELILRSNNLPSIDLQIGQVLKVPQLDTAIVVDRATSTLTLFNKNVFFKEYPLLAPVPGTAGVDTSVREKVAVRDGKRVIFGGADYPGSERSIILEQNAPAIRGGSPTASGGGIVISQHDVEEIFPLVTRGTRVIIR
ncbi:MAG: LysM peptidoglycan-binding domain-containing protein [Chthoniobacterales bacterium]